MGSLLAIRRYELLMTQEQVAELAGISLRALKQIEAGKANPGLQPLLRLLYVLGLQLTLNKRTSS
ncbi:helix-turn-helix transcriptional regulator [Hymenobacter lapidiphilus]|uniref:Helix-turn-helix domain-containing protein n=1 Tax=Hymenobacter lapidiphilus TaxID=2608003 RepID=A0A7Y7PS11_9BACT|nr:helix-turn-helix domain-containing protein [Hymenobacter lapidiphilus]